MDLILMINHIITFILLLYGDPNLPRKIIDVVIAFINNFMREVFIPSLKNDILTILEKENIGDYSLMEIKTCFNKYGKIFETVDTEAKIFQLLKKRGLVDCEEFVVGNTFVEKIKNNDTILVQEKIYGVFISLRKSLKLFLEIPGLFVQILDYTKMLNKESLIITNIMQATLWKNKYCEKFVDTIVLPLYLFYDDLEVGNVLGSHKGTNKFAAIYVTIA